MPQANQVQIEPVSRVAGRILIAWRSGHCALLVHELQHARRLTSLADEVSTFEMERLEALTGAVESLESGEWIEAGRVRPAAVRVLEHLAQPEQLTQTAAF
jgi:predicted MarR family transcription regulator